LQRVGFTAEGIGFLRRSFSYFSLHSRPPITLPASICAAGISSIPSMRPVASIPFQIAARYPEPAFEVIDPSFAKYRIFSANVEQLGSGLRWAEGPVWFGDGKYLLVSDVPSDTIYRWDETTGDFTAWRSPSSFANGHCRDQHGRLLGCSHGGRSVVRTEHNGAITTLASHFEGKRLNSPNDIVCARDGSIWFTDPTFGILSEWEGAKAEPELGHAVYRIAPDGGLHRVITDLNQPNGLAFSPDEKTLYVVESRAAPHRLIWAYDVAVNKTLSNKRQFCSADGPGAFDGIKVDVDGNLWCGFGSSGAPEAKPEALDGVRVYNPQGALIGMIHLPERCANLCFGGAKNNRLFMAASHSVYAIYVNTCGAV
jgi:gluconolactonase